ncbi:MAG: DUF167 domain-containing protein [Actinomycetota bacterium]
MDVSDLYRTEPADGGPGDGTGDDPGDRGRPATVVLNVHVQPAAGRSAVVGRHGTALKVRVGASPEGGRANEACAALLAETFGVKGSKVELVNGATSRSKQFRVMVEDLDEFRRRLEQVSAGAAPGGSSRQPGPGRR